jgi:RNA polymerase sigma-70 factor (ECF subfamily)
MKTEDKMRFEEIYLEYRDVLGRIAFNHDVPVDYIDDVVQDTFVAYARYEYALDLPPERMKMLLAKIVKSRCMDYHRKMKRRATGELEDEDLSSEDYCIGARTQGLPEFVVSKEKCQAILEEIERMPDNWKDVAILRLIEGRTTREVCEILHISEKACYSRVSRIRKYLEELMSREDWP